MSDQNQGQSAGPETPAWPDVASLLQASRPVAPVYCIHPRRYQRAARDFLSGFPGRVLYAVKANDDPRVLHLLHAAGVRHYDCASLPEIELVHRHCPDSTAYFMTPVRLRGAAAEVHRRFGTRHFMVDSEAGLSQLVQEIPVSECVVFVRMAVRHPGAMQNFSAKFGASPAETGSLLEAVRRSGAEPGLAFNVGSSVVTPEAYTDALGVARGVLEALPFRLRLIDLGGGFPLTYPGFEVPPLGDFFRDIAAVFKEMPLVPGAELMAEPGRALSAPGLSAVVEVLLRKDERVYLNDGMYGIFWELRFNGHRRYPVRAFREGLELIGPLQSFTLFGPTCDGSDVLPEAFELPADIRPGDHLEFSQIGAYSLAGRTRFNGHYSEQVVYIENE